MRWERAHLWWCGVQLYICRPGPGKGQRRFRRPGTAGEGRRRDGGWGGRGGRRWKNTRKTPEDHDWDRCWQLQVSASNRPSFPTLPPSPGDTPGTPLRRDRQYHTDMMYKENLGVLPPRVQPFEEIQSDLRRRFTTRIWEGVSARGPAS